MNFRPTVLSSPEFLRIKNLPRRTLDLSLAEKVTQQYKTPPGTMVLRPLQAAALEEAVQCQGLLASMGVGEGKTLLAFLLFTAFKSNKGLFLVPPSLIPQVIRVREEMSKHWQILPSIKLMSHSDLSNKKCTDFLNEYRPDCIVVDEAHAFKHIKSVRTKRLLEYLKQGRKSGELKAACFLSGTLFFDSILNLAHLAKYALGTNSPLPIDYHQLMIWSAAVDPLPFYMKGKPGVLKEFGSDVVRGLQKRMTETKGFVASTGNTKISASLLIQERKIEVPTHVTELLAKLRDTWCTPWDEEITEALEYWRYMSQLGAGLNYKRTWPGDSDPQQQKAWLEARRNWFSSVRKFLTGTPRAGIDSPALYEEAVVNGTVQNKNYQTWCNIKDTLSPGTETIWSSNFLVKDAVSWGQKEPGIVWYSHKELGKEIAARGNFPLYGGGTDPGLEKGDRTIVASVDAHGTGKELQMFNRMLITTPLDGGGAAYEQTIGRLHRSSQKASSVTVDIYLHIKEYKKSFEEALANANWLGIIKNEVQKLTYADKGFEYEIRGTS